MKRISTQNLYRLIAMALLTALSVVSILVVQFPIIPAAPFLIYDIADIFILLGCLIISPLAGLIVLVLASVIQAFTVSAGSGLYGLLMHLVASGVLVIVFSLFLYIGKKHTAYIIAGMVCGTLAMTLVMIPMNLLVTPYFLGTPVQAIKELLLPAFIPFNLLKAGLNSALTLMIFLPLKPILIKNKLMQ